MSNMFAALADSMPKKKAAPAPVSAPSPQASSVQRTNNNSKRDGSNDSKKGEGIAKRDTDDKKTRNKRKGDSRDRQSRGGQGSNRSEKKGGAGKGNWGSDGDAMKKGAQEVAEGEGKKEVEAEEPDNTLTLAEYKAKMAGKTVELKTVRELNSKDDKFNSVVSKKDVSSDAQFHSKNKAVKQKKTKAVIETGVFYQNTDREGSNNDRDRSNKRNNKRGGRNGKKKSESTGLKLKDNDFPSL